MAREKVHELRHEANKKEAIIKRLQDELNQVPRRTRVQHKLENERLTEENKKLSAEVSAASEGFKTLQEAHDKLQKKSAEQEIVIKGLKMDLDSFDKQYQELSKKYEMLLYGGKKPEPTVGQVAREMTLPQSTPFERGEEFKRTE